MDCESQIIVKVAAPANDNTLIRVRALTATDVKCIAHENRLRLAVAFDSAARREMFWTDPVKTAARELARMHDLQRTVVWRGSWLTRDEVQALTEDGSLLIACCEVIRLTLHEGRREELTTVLLGVLRPDSRYLGETTA